jgi:hypothetical protein
MTDAAAPSFGRHEARQCAGLPSKALQSEINAKCVKTLGIALLLLLLGCADG